MADTVIFNNPSMAFVDTGRGLFLWQEVPSTITLTVGETYLVEWNGEQFNCVAVSANLNGVDGIGIGNLAFAGVGGDTNEPFLLGTALDGSFSACYTTETNAANSMAIYHVVEEDKEYLIWGSTLKAIGDAIREKTGKTEDIPPLDMPGEIRGITGGGGSDDVRYVTFKSYDGSETYGVKPVAVGDDCADPIERGLFETPTMESTAQYNYTFAGWSTSENGGLDENALKAVTEDRTVYANFVATLVYYTISYYDGDTLLKTESLAYGTVPSYSPKKDGYTFNGWTPEIVAVKEDATYYAKWIEKITFANASWEQIANVSESGMASETFAVGDTKEIAWGGNSYKLVVLGFDHDDLADGSGKAGMTIGCLTANPTTATCTATYGMSYYSRFTDTNAYAVIKSFLSQSDLAEIVAVAKPVKKGYTRNVDDDVYNVNETFFAFNAREVGFNQYDTTGDAYAYFTSNSSRTVMKAGTTTAVQYWLRGQSRVTATVAGTNGYWSTIDTKGTYSTVAPISNSNYLVFGFCI